MLRIRQSARVQQGETSGAAPAPFLSRTVSFADLLAADPTVSQYISALEAEQCLETSLAQRMSITDWRAVLPSGAPYGHCVRLHEIAERSSQYEVVPPDSSAGWKFYARLFGTRAVNDNHVLEFTYRNLESLMIMTSLFLIIAVDSLLSLPPCPPATDGGCSGLLWADAALWLSAVVFLFFGATSSFVLLCYHGMFLTPATAAQHIFHNWMTEALPIHFWFFGLFALWGATGVRVIALASPDDSRGYVVLSVLVGSASFITLFFWPLIISQHLGISFFSSISEAVWANVALHSRKIPTPEKSGAASGYHQRG